MFERTEKLFGQIKTGYKECNGLDFELMCAILKHMNASINVKISGAPGFIDEQGKSYGMIKDVTSETVDLTMNKFMLHDYYWKMQAFPFYMTRLKIISLKDPIGYTESFLQILNVKGVIFFLMTCWVLIIALKHVLNQPTSEAALNFVRMLVSSSTVTEPRTFLRRISFLALMFAAFIVGSHFASDLSALSTVPDRAPTIDSIDDLMKSNLTIYGMSNHKEWIWKKEIHKRYQVTNDYQACVHRFSENAPVPCICLESLTKFYLHETETIHVSSNNVAEGFSTYILAEDSPFLHKFNLILLKLSEGGFLKLFEVREERFAAKFPDESNDGKKSVSMTQLSFFAF